MVSAISRLPASCRTVVVQGGGLLGLYACVLLRERGVEDVVQKEHRAFRRGHFLQRHEQREGEVIGDLGGRFW